ncbi:MAG: molybdenum ABC transporter ATP-binding protein [Caldithrix sp.]|nr:MAG: molybdenum ABC transporter ATP-binding protein [Caldithrix sp.]
MLQVRAKKCLAGFELELDFELQPSFTALFGASGSGKTTTLNLIAGLLTPDQGEVILDGSILFSKRKKINIKPRDRHIGYIFQESRLFPHLRVQENLEFGLQRLPANERKFSFDEIVEVAGLTGLLERTPHALSGGEKQRVALARAILASPHYLLLDEPLAALDLPARLAFLKFLKDIHGHFNLPMLYVSHDLSNVVSFANDVIILDNGRNTGYGPPYEMLDKLAAAPLISREDIPNILEVRVERHDTARGVTLCRLKHLELVLPRLDCAEGEKLLLNIPASEIIVAVEEPRGLSASNVFRGTVARISRLRERVMVEVNAGESFTVEIVEATVARLDLRPGKEIFLIFKASSFRRLGNS